MLIQYDDFCKLMSLYEINIDFDCYNKLNRYAELLVEWNKVMNLTGITDDMGISEKHMLDSLLIFKYIDVPNDSRIIDVGTGAGFPGMPMKLFRNDIKMTLMDSLNKRINFLNDVSTKCSVDVENVHMRAEEGGCNPKYREKFDFAVARAVAALPVLTEYCLPYVKVGGSFIAMKGPNEDLTAGENAVKLLGGRIEKVIEYTLPCGDKRVIVSIKKISATPTKYPRNSGQISKKHL